MNPDQIDGKVVGLDLEGNIFFTPPFFDKIAETVKPLILEELEKREELGWCHDREYKLDEARTNERIAGFPEKGDCVLVISLDGSAEIKWDSANADAFDLEIFRKIRQPFEDLYLTNAAQPGKTLKLRIGKGDFDIIKTVPEIDLSGLIRNDYLEQITDPLKIGEIIENGHIKPHADIACEKILITGTTRLDQWRSTEDYTYIAPGKILLHAPTKLSDWQHPSDTTYIHGGQIYTESILTAALAALSITTEKLAVGAATAEKINVDQLSAIAANVGILTAGLIKSTDAKTLFDLTNGYMSVSDGVYTRFKAGKLNGDYGTEIRDVDGNITVDLGKIVGGVDYAIVTASNEITTNSAAYVDMVGGTQDMVITKTLPKCKVLLLSHNWGWAPAPASDMWVRFTVNGDPVGYGTGVQQDIKAFFENMWVVSLLEGTYTFRLQWKTTGGAGTIYSRDRELMILYWYVT